MSCDVLAVSPVDKSRLQALELELHCREYGWNSLSYKKGLLSVILPDDPKWLEDLSSAVNFLQSSGTTEGQTMHQQKDKTTQELQREVDKLQAELQQERLKLKSFEEGLAEMNTGLMSLIDNNFDGNVYRNALEHSFKEHVYTKIRNLFGTIAIIAGIGGFFFVNVTIEKMVTNTIEKKSGEFLQASHDLTRERLIFMLRDLKESPERAARIREEPRMLPYLTELVRSEGDPTTQIRAIEYAGTVQEKKLLEPLLEILEDGKNPEVRVQALKALLGFLPNPKVAEKIDEVMSVESNTVDTNPTSRLWLELTDVLSRAKYHSDETRDMANSQMQVALRSKRPELFRAAVLFYLLNKELWEDSFEKTIRIRKRKEWGGLIKSPEGESNEKFLDEEISQTESYYAYEQLNLIRGYVALAKLEKGKNKDNWVLRDVLHPLNDEASPPVFPAAVWNDVLTNLFPDFRPSIDTTDYTQAEEPIRPQPYTSEEQWQQSELWSRLNHYEWIEDKNRYTYIDPQALSITKLKTGNSELFKEILNDQFMYYEDENWRQILDLFPEFRDEWANEGVFKDRDWQDIFNEYYLSLYKWDEEKKRWVVVEEELLDQESVIYALEQGDKEMLEWYLSEYGPLDSEYWRLAMEMFPDFSDNDKAQEQPVDIEEQQRRLLEELDFQQWDEVHRVYLRKEDQKE